MGALADLLQTVQQGGDHGLFAVALCIGVQLLLAAVEPDQLGAQLDESLVGRTAGSGRFCRLIK